MMRNNKIALITLMLALLFSVSPLNAGAASSSVPSTVKVKTQQLNLIFDGQELKLPDKQYSFIYQGSTYVPIRYISYALQKSVGWNSEKKKVTVTEPTEKELVELKKQLQNATSGNKKPQASIAIQVKPVQATLLFDKAEKKLPDGQLLFIYNGSIYVPLRFLAESVGTEIGWNAATRTISGESDAYRAQFGKDDETTAHPDNGNEDDKDEENTGGDAGTSAGGGSGGGVSGGKPTYEAITSGAQSSLETLRNNCKAVLIDLGLQYYSADASGRPQILTQITGEIDSCTAKFETIMSDVTAKLTANGYSTAIIAEYRAAFEAELAAGRAIAEGLDS